MTKNVVYGMAYEGRKIGGFRNFLHDESLGGPVRFSPDRSARLTDRSQIFEGSGTGPLFQICTDFQMTAVVLAAATDLSSCFQLIFSLGSLSFLWNH